MERAGLTVGRLLLVVAVLAGSIALLVTGVQSFVGWCVVTGIALVLVGALTNRMWVLAVPDRRDRPAPRRARREARRAAVTQRRTILNFSRFARDLLPAASVATSDARRRPRPSRL